MPKNKTPDAATPVADNAANGGSADVPAVDATPADDGVRPAPYDAAWINVAAAAKRAEVTTQTVRNAYREHAAFTPEVDGNPRPAYFTTKMVDAFGNVTDYDVVYLDSAAVDAWIVARAEKAASGGNIGGKHGGAKRRIIRLTQDQIDALPKNDAGNPFITLADGTAVVVETPAMGKKAADADDAAPANGVEVTTADADGAVDANGADTLFDVALVEGAAPEA